MATKVKSGFCEACNAQRKVERPGVSGIEDLIHFILTIVTLFWIIIWIWRHIGNGPWRCSTCGSTNIQRVR